VVSKSSLRNANPLIGKVDLEGSMPTMVIFGMHSLWEKSFQPARNCSSMHRRCMRSLKGYEILEE